MSRTTFSGPVKSDNGFEGSVTGNVVGNVLGTVTGTIILPTATAANLGSIANAINTTGKVTGKTVVDIATGVIYTASGTDTYTVTLSPAPSAYSTKMVMVLMTKIPVRVLKVRQPNLKQNLNPKKKMMRMKMRWKKVTARRK